MLPFCELLKRHRVHCCLTLRQLSEMCGHPAANLSRMERGVVSPPRDGGVLVRLADAFCLAPGSGERQAFFDAAMLGRGLLPGDISSDAGALKRISLEIGRIRCERGG